jgi:hypothetical protein
MSGFIEDEDRHQTTLFSEHLDDCIAEDNAVRLSEGLLEALTRHSQASATMKIIGPWMYGEMASILLCTQCSNQAFLKDQQ